MLRLVIFISCLLVVTNVSADCTQSLCIAVIDAGSTGARLHIFSYNLDKTNTPMHIQEIWSKKITPGFATIDSNQSTVDAYLNHLFSEAPTQSIPVYFYATGGMRLVPLVKQKIYYHQLKNWFNQHPQWQLIEAKTISGNDEALYGWLTVNYHLDKFKSSSNQPIGVIDVGGASVQIVFPMQKNATYNKESQIELDLYGQHIHLFVHSFLGLGLNEMTHQFLDTASCFSEGYPLENGDLGKGDVLSCAKVISSLVNRVHKVKNQVQPLLKGQPIHSWYVMGGLANLVESKPFEFQNNQLTNYDLLQQANGFICHQQWDILSNEFPDNEYVELFCLLSTFYYALMVDGYGFSTNQLVNYIPSTQSLDWTLGVVLYH